MPGFYPIDEYDLAGFCVGMVDREKVIDGSTMAEGDAIIGIQSSGVHSNGFSLVRKVFDVNEENLKQYYEELGTTLGEALLTPTKIYVRPMLSLMKTCTVKAVSHVTGGGFYENLPRMMKSGYTAKIDTNAFPTLPIFDLIQKVGNIPTEDMYSTFNMGIGMCVVVPASEAEKAIAHLKENGEEAFLIGTVVKGEEGVVLC